MASGPWDNYKTDETDGPWNSFKEEAPKEDSHWYDQLNAAAGTVGDLAMGIPKFGAAAALGLAARGVGAVTGNKATLKDTMDTANQMIEEAVPSYKNKDLAAYKVPMYPLQKLSEGAEYLGRKAGEATGNGDVAGAVELGTNLAAIPLGLKAGGMVLKGLKGKPGEPVAKTKIDALEEMEKPAETDGPWNNYLANQSELPGAAGAFDNIRRQTSGEIEPSKDITNTPMERVTDSLLNGKDQAAVVGAENAEGLKPQVEASQAEAEFWKNRAEQMTAEEQAKQLPPERIDVNREGTAADPATMDALTRSTEGITYENVPPDGVIPRDANRLPTGEPMLRVPRGNEWAVDENGIPVRQGLPESTVAPDYINKYMRQDESARNDLGNAIQEANGPKLGPDEAFGSEPLKTGSPVLDNALAEVARPSLKGRTGGGQRGGIDPNLLGIEQIAKLIRGTGDLLKRGIDSFEQFSKTPLAKVVGRLPEDHMRAIPGMKESLDGIIPRPMAGSEFVNQAIAEGAKNPSFPKMGQSGALLAGEKFKSAALKGVGQWLQYAANKSAFRVKAEVVPIERHLAQLPRTEFQELHQVLIAESERGALYSQENLSKVLNPKQLEAYKALRKAMDETWDMSVATRKALGLPEVPKLEGYMASMRYGDWHLPIYDKSGKLVWHVASTSKAHANRALEWIKKEMGDKIDLTKSEAMFKPELGGPIGIPRDIISGYHELLKFLDKDDPTTSFISDAIAKFNEDHGLLSRRHNERFMRKAGIPGFEGNKPWLSEHENASNFFHAQMGYLKNSFQWNHLQEALGQIKEITKSPELNQTQPNLIKYAQALVDRETGVSKNMFKALETGIARVVPSITIGNGKIHTGVGVSRSSLYKTTSDIKSGVYLQQLGLNPGYMIATPLQGILSVALHRMLSNEGFTHSAMKTTMNTVRDTSVALMQHYLYAMSEKHVKVPGMSDLGRRALQYAEDNNVINKTILDEYQTLGEHRVWGQVKAKLSGSITTPEKVGRTSVFMSFAHHLVDSGMKETEAFRKAAEFTNHAMTSMEKHDRPLMVDKLGVPGELAYQYHSYLFNEMNQLSLLARHAIEKKAVTPLVSHMGALMFLGGALALPMVNELDGLWNLFKDGVAKTYPEHYKTVGGLGLKGTMLNGINDFATGATVSGPLSEMMGTAMGQRFSMALLDPEHPTQQIAAAPQEVREWASAGTALLHPTKRNAEQAAWVNSPPLIKGQMETRLDDFKNKNENSATGRNPDGTMSYRKAGDINDVGTDYARTSNDEKIRQFGLTSNEEYRTRQLRHINNDEQTRMMSAEKGILAQMVTRMMDKDSEGTRKYATAALQLIPDDKLLEKALNEAINDRMYTPEQRDKVRSDSMATLLKVRRLNAQ
jgi:hypothetical protein